MLVAMLLVRGAGAGAVRPKAAGAGVQSRCRSAVVEAEVRAGAGFRGSFGAGLDVMLEPIASGWAVRVVPTHGARPAVDYAEIATPPYRSVSPLLLSTDFSFRAQDAVGWNPRRFRYAGTGQAYGRLEDVYRRVTRVPAASPADEAELGRLVAMQPAAVIEILDASIVPGTADPTRAAALVSTHFGTTAHTTERPENGRVTPLGRIGWMRVRVRLELPPGAAASPGVRVESGACEGG